MAAVTDRRAARVAAGLDALELSGLGSASKLQAAARTVLPKLAAAAVLLAAWQLVVFLQLKPTYVIPAPSDVWSAFADQWNQGHSAEAVSTSVRRGAFGFAVSIVLGTALGLVVARFRVVRLAIGSLIAGLQSLPSVTWVPVGIVWFGLSESTIYFVVIMGALPSIASGVISASDHIAPILIKAGRTMGARGIPLYRHIILPAALPGYMAGLKQAWSFSWRSLMAAELITLNPNLGLGLGQLLDSGRELSDMTLVMMSILVILAVGVAVDSLFFSPLDRLIRSRRGLAV